MYFSWENVICISEDEGKMDDNAADLRTPFNMISKEDCHQFSEEIDAGDTVATLV